MDDDLAIESTAVGHAFHGNIHVSGPGLTVLGNVYDARRVRGTNLESQVEATFAKAGKNSLIQMEDSRFANMVYSHPQSTQIRRYQCTQDSHTGNRAEVF